ncbi:MAG: hypothetical protein AAEJ04_06145 [Planctomycetota bacterium]
MDSGGNSILHQPPLFRLTLALSLALLTLLSGCKRGTALAEAQAPLIENFAVDVQLNSATVGFDVNDPLQRQWEAWIFFSDDMGVHWNPITTVKEGENQIPLTPPFEPVATSWSFRGDLLSLPQADVLLQIRLIDIHGQVQAEAQSDPLSIGESTAPIVHSVNVPTGPIGGAIPVTAFVSDAEGDHVTVQVEWSLAGSDPWFPATLESTNSDMVFPVQSEGTPLMFHWHSHVDTPNVISPFARLRIIAADASGQHLQQSPTMSLNTVPPIIESLTIGEIPGYLNGSEPYLTDSGTEIPFYVSVPDRGARITVSWASGLGGAAPDSSTLSIESDQVVAQRAPGSDLSDLFSITGNSASWIVPDNSPIPLGTLSLWASIEDLRGNPALTFGYQFHVAPGSANVRPFDWHDRWSLDFTRDNYTITIDQDSTGDFIPNSVYGADGQSDHRQDLLTIGLQSNQPLPSAAATQANQKVLLWTEDAILEQIRDHYGAGSLPDGSDLQPRLSFQKETQQATSFIGIGGDDVEPVSYALGRAAFDFRNSTGNDERSPQRGVFTSNMVQFYWNSWTFRNRFSGVLPGLGIPVSEHSLDAVVLGNNFERLDPSNTNYENLRYDEIWEAIDAWSRIVAVVASHEIGHAVGLCANNPPPVGLFGGVQNADFSGPFTTAYHVDTPGLNVMASALGLTSALVEGDSGYSFNELNRAYLAEWITLEP